MAGFADYEAYDALGLADLVRGRKVTPTELLDAAIARIEARNPAINAVVLPLYDYARKAIADGLPDGPFRGVPYLLKDLTASLAGVKTMRGSRFFADTPPAAADSEPASTTATKHLSQSICRSCGVMGGVLACGYRMETM